MLAEKAPSKSMGSNYDGNSSVSTEKMDPSVLLDRVIPYKVVNTFVQVESEEHVQQRRRRSSCPASLRGRTSLDNESEHPRVNLATFQRMRQAAEKLGRSTTWLRVVHSGYGHEPWAKAIHNKGLTVVFCRSQAEGAYILVPEGQTADDVTTFLIALNRQVRERTRFAGMNRANKARLHFKSALITIDADTVERPELVPARQPLPISECNGCTNADEQCPY
jgi:hypothetical protein